MFPSFYGTSVLNSPLTSGGSETTVSVNSVTTLTGEALSFSYLAPFTKGYIIIDPENQFGTQPEIISFTGIDTTNLAFTGCVRGLSSVTTGTVTSNKVYHGAGTPVIISWGAQNISDLITYVNGLVSGSIGNASLTVAGTTKLTATVASLPRAKATLVSQDTTSGSMKVSVNPFSFIYNGTTYSVASSTLTSSMVAPVTNPRIDLIVYSTTSVAIAIRTGTEAASPTAPTPTEGDIVLATISHRVGETKILETDDSTNGFIKTWYEPSVYSGNTYLTTGQTTFGTDKSQTVENTAYPVGEANATTKHALVAQSFVPTVSGIQGVKLYKTADTGSFTGTVKVALQADSSGSPSGSDLATYTITNAVWLKLNASAEFAIAFSTEYESMVIGNTYWIVVTPSTSDSSNHPNLGSDNTSAHGVILKYNNSTDGWVVSVSTSLYFKTTTGIISKVVKTDSTSGLVPTAIRPYSLVGFDTTVVPNSSTAATTAYSTEIEGGFWGLNTGIKVTCWIDFVGGGATITAKINYNGSQLGLFSTTFSTSAADPAGTLTFYVVNQNSLSSQKYTSTFLATTQTSGTATGLSVYNTLRSGTSAVDTSQPGLLELVIQTSSTSGSQAITNSFTIVEKIG